MKSIAELLNNLTPDIYVNLKQAVELGKWPNGGKLTSEQRDLCMHAMIAYEKQHLPPEQHSGFIPPKEHTHCGSTKGDIADDKEHPLNFNE